MCILLYQHTKPTAYIDQGDCNCGSGSELTLGGTCNAQCPGDSWRTCGATDGFAGSVFKTAFEYSTSAQSLYTYAFQGYQVLARGLLQINLWDPSASTVPQCVTLCASQYAGPYAVFNTSSNRCYCNVDVGDLTYTTSPSELLSYAIEPFVDFDARHMVMRWLSKTSFTQNSVVMSSRC